MFKRRKIQRRAKALYKQMRDELSVIIITGESFYEPNYRLEFNVGKACYRLRFSDETFPLKLKYNEIVKTNADNITSFVAYAIASYEYERKPEKYIKIYNTI